ncbi:MAG: hypothetical protein ACRDD1_17505, partial [Planctomycetia bacterium]
YMHPLCRAAIQKIAAAAVAGGLSWGALTRNRDHAEFCRELGARLFVIGGDLGVVNLGLRTLKAQYNGYFDQIV